MCLTDKQPVKYLLAFHESIMLHYCMAANLNRLTGTGEGECVFSLVSEICNAFIPQNV